MGNGYNHHHHHQHHHLIQKGTFLPMLCSRPSMKDVVALPRLEDRSTSFSAEPLSPKIGCMGQVKRHNNKIIGFPTSSSSSSSSSVSSSFNKISAITPSVKYSKLRRIFSAKNSNFTASTIATAIPNTTTSNCGRRKGVILNNGATNRGPKIDDSKENSLSSSISTIRIEDMDPPLPVIKKVHKPAGMDGNGGGEEQTLWKRRSGGVALKNLQLQQIQLNRHNFAPTTV